MDAKAKATVVADSLAPSGVRLTTMLLTYATMVHQDMLTHRTVYKFRAADGGDEWAEIDASKSTNSNRAKPTKDVLREVWQTPYVPTRFPKRAASMHSSRGYLTGWRHHCARQLWLKGRYLALALACLLMWLPGVHKQIANRVLMPWTMTTLVMTAVDVWWRHFFTLRDHYAAQDEVQDVAQLAAVAYAHSQPESLQVGEWHLPWVSKAERIAHNNLTCIRLSVARCARTSYARTHEEMIDMSRKRPLRDDLALFGRLAVMEPPHDGPREHQAWAHSVREFRSGNLHGWDQLRHSRTGAELVRVAKQKAANALSAYPA